MLRYLAVLAVMLACFTGDVSAVTDQEFQEFSTLMVEMKAEIQELSDTVKRQASENVQLRKELESVKYFQQEGIIQNTTIEERVTLLETQMSDVQEDIPVLFDNDNFLFEEQVIQDERLLNLEVASDEIEDDVEALQDLTLALDFRVTELEENGGSDGNSSISELEVRVETLEATSDDHETRITSTEENVDDLEGTSADHETRLTAAEENIQGLQMTDIDHESRITALEENGGGGGSQNETIAFHAVLTSYDTIPDETVVEFNEIVLNQGNGYDSATGVFTVPSGGDGLYYFSTYLLVSHSEYGYFDMRLNDDVICSAMGDHDDGGVDDYPPATCSAVVSVVEGDEVKLVCRFAIDDTPLYATSSYYFNGFNGFRI